MKVQKTRKYYRKENHNKKLFQERKNRFLENIENDTTEDILTVEIEHKKPAPIFEEKKDIIAPKIITPNIGSVVNHIDTEMIHLLKDPKKLKEFKEFQEFLKMKETAKLNNAAPTSPVVTPLKAVLEQHIPTKEQKEKHNNTTNENEMDPIEEEIEEEEEFYEEEY
jgi:hypothetical protein